MALIQILDCSDTLGTCCSDYGIVSVLDVIRKVLELFQLLVPILLIVGTTVQFIVLASNPEAKDGLKKLSNKYIAAVVCFFLPIIVNVVLNLLPENFEISSCWQTAKVSAEMVRMQESKYINPHTKEAKSIIINADDYEKASKNNDNSNSSDKAKEIVAYAKSFVGQRYVYGGSWNGELPYTGTDCSGFVQGVFKHFGINLSRTTYSQWADTNSYTLVSSGSIQAGDLVMYDGHVGILTGNGYEMVHAQSTRTGIVLSNDYRTCSSKAILGIMRIKGVN